MSFLRHEEICRPMSSVPGRSYPDRPRPPRFDEFPAGYSLAGCAPALPASASPAEAHRGARRSSCTIEKQRTVGSVLTVCLTQGDKPRPHRTGCPLCLQPLFVVVCRCCCSSGGSLNSENDADQ
jgi:ribosomal protein L32